MTISNYLCHVVGIHPKRAASFHPSTVQRTTAFAIAIHIPVLMWGVTGYVIAAHIFMLGEHMALLVALMCAGLIYLVERIVLATPKIWFVNLVRALIGIVIAVLGASTVDLVIFDREVSQQLRQAGEVQLKAEHERVSEAQRTQVAQKKADWLRAVEAANCEANGTCGSKTRNVGPVYREMARQAELLRADYMAAQVQLEQMVANKTHVLAAWRDAPTALQQAGLLARVEALHQYTRQNTAAFVAWLLFFALVLFFELMVVLAKLVFGETVDDEIDRIRERISQQRAHAYMDAATSPVTAARTLIAQSLA